MYGKLFRGQDVLTGEWVHGYYVCVGGVEQIYTGDVETVYTDNQPNPVSQPVLHHVCNTAIDTLCMDNRDEPIYEWSLLRNEMFGDLWVVMISNGKFIVQCLGKGVWEDLDNVVGFDGSAFRVVGYMDDEGELCLRND